MFRSMIVMCVLALCAGCHSDPYAGYDGNLQQGPVQKTTNEATSPIQAQTLVDVTEGASVPVPITGQVTTGKPVFSFIGLPPFASYDNNGTLTFSPPVGTSRDPSFPAGGEYKVVLVMSSTAEPQTKITKDMVVVVHALSQTLVVGKFTPLAQIVEGDTFNGTVDVQTTNTSITVSGVGAPEGLKITATPSPTTYAISYSPSFLTVLAASGNYCSDASGLQVLCKTFKWTLNVVDSVGESVSVPATWSVLDYRQDPSLQFTSTPDILTTSVPNGTTTTTSQLSASYYLQVQDPNGETVPSFTVDTPTFGQAAVTIVNSVAASKGTLPYALAKVSVTGVPDTNKGQSETINVTACVQDVNGHLTNCKSIPSSVSF